MSIEPKRIVIKKKLDNSDPSELLEILKKETTLSASQIKEALIQGSCSVRKGNSKVFKRIRRAKSVLRAGDMIEFNFDQDLFAKQKAGFEKSPILIRDDKSWSAWVKPAGCLAQGTKFGDALSLLRHAEKSLNRDAFLIGRLDRETVGLMVIAHNKKMSRLLSDAWSKVGLVQKSYQAMVKGVVEEEQGVINEPIDGKKAITHFKVLKRGNHWTILELELKTGRTHQIRKHLLSLGHPVIGDSRYGEGNKNKDGLMLVASRLKFKISAQEVDLSVPEEFSLLRPS